MLLTLPNLLSTEELSQARAWLKDAPWEPGLGTAGRQAAMVKHNEQLPKKIYKPRINRYAGDSN